MTFSETAVIVPEKVMGLSVDEYQSRQTKPGEPFQAEDITSAKEHRNKVRHSQESKWLRKEWQAPGSRQIRLEGRGHRPGYGVPGSGPLWLSTLSRGLQKAPQEAEPQGAVLSLAGRTRETLSPGGRAGGSLLGPGGESWNPQSHLSPVKGESLRGSYLASPKPAFWLPRARSICNGQ